MPSRSEPLEHPQDQFASSLSIFTSHVLLNSIDVAISEIFLFVFVIKYMIHILSYFMK